MTGPFDDVTLQRLRARQTVKWSLHGPDVLAAWVAEMDFDIAPVVRAALHDAIDRDDLGYVVADQGELTTACSDFFEERYAWSVAPSRIFTVADVLYGIAGALEQFVAPAAPVVVPSPAYPPFFEIIELTGRPVIEVPMMRSADDRWVLDLDAIDSAFGRGARALLLCNPHNPTGRAFEPDELEALASVVDRHNARVIADEVHAPLVYPTRRHVPYASVSEVTAAHAVTVTSASKAFNLAGLKCAQVITSNHDDASRWRKLRTFEVAGPTPLGLAASTAAYRSGGPWLDELVGYLDGNRRRLAELVTTHLPECQYRIPDATFLAWIDCTRLGFSDPAAHFLHETAVAVSDGPPFGTGNDQMIRLNFATSRALLEGIVGAMGQRPLR